MLFEFNIKLTDEDYLKFNEFWNLKSHYGKSQMLKFRILVCVMILLSSGVRNLYTGFADDTITHLIVTVIVTAIVQLFLNRMMSAYLKSYMKSLKKKGKPGYSPGENTLTEITPTARAEQAYSAIERISIVGDGPIYLHLNNLGGYIVPASAFSTAENRAAFIEFIKTKCQNIDLY